MSSVDEVTPDPVGLSTCVLIPVGTRDEFGTPAYEALLPISGRVIGGALVLLPGALEDILHSRL